MERLEHAHGPKITPADLVLVCHCEDGQLQGGTFASREDRVFNDLADDVTPRISPGCMALLHNASDPTRTPGGRRRGRAVLLYMQAVRDGRPVVTAAGNAYDVVRASVHRLAVKPGEPYEAQLLEYFMTRPAWRAMFQAGQDAVARPRRRWGLWLALAAAPLWLALAWPLFREFFAIVWNIFLAVRGLLAFGRSVGVPE